MRERFIILKISHLDVDSVGNVKADREEEKEGEEEEEEGGERGGGG